MGILIILISILGAYSAFSFSRIRELTELVNSHSELFSDLSKVHSVQSKSYQALVVKVMQQDKALQELYLSYFRDERENSEVIQ